MLKPAALPWRARSRPGQTLRITCINGVAGHVAAMSQELEALPPVAALAPGFGCLR